MNLKDFLSYPKDSHIDAIREEWNAKVATGVAGIIVLGAIVALIVVK